MTAVNWSDFAMACSDRDRYGANADELQKNVNKLQKQIDHLNNKNYLVEVELKRWECRYDLLQARFVQLKTEKNLDGAGCSVDDEIDLEDQSEFRTLKHQELHQRYAREVADLNHTVQCLTNDMEKLKHDLIEESVSSNKLRNKLMNKVNEVKMLKVEHQDKHNKLNEIIEQQQVQIDYMETVVNNLELQSFDLCVEKEQLQSHNDSLRQSYNHLIDKCQPFVTSFQLNPSQSGPIPDCDSDF